MADTAGIGKRISAEQRCAVLLRRIAILFEQLRRMGATSGTEDVPKQGVRARPAMVGQENRSVDLANANARCEALDRVIDPDPIAVASLPLMPQTGGCERLAAALVGTRLLALH